jgi:hypothetical protein
MVDRDEVVPVDAGLARRDEGAVMKRDFREMKKSGMQREERSGWTGDGVENTERLGGSTTLEKNGSWRKDYQLRRLFPTLRRPARAPFFDSHDLPAKPHQRLRLTAGITAGSLSPLLPLSSPFTPFLSPKSSRVRRARRFPASIQ